MTCVTSPPCQIEGFIIHDPCLGMTEGAGGHAHYSSSWCFDDKKRVPADILIVKDVIAFELDDVPACGSQKAKMYMSEYMGSITLLFN